MKPQFLCVLALLAWPLAPLASEAPLATEALARLKSYDAGQINASLVALEQRIARLSGDPAQREPMAAQLAAILAEPGTTAAAKLFICQQLRVVGGIAQVPLLASLLHADQTADMARLVLEAIPGEAAGQALIRALAGSRDLRLIGIINSLAARRETAAVPELSRLLADPAPPIAGAAARALGRIASSDAARALLSLKRGDLDPALWDALLVCAQSLGAGGASAEALRIYDTLSESSNSANRRLAVLSGRVRTDPAGSLPRLLEALKSDDSQLQAQAATLSVLVPGEAATRDLTGLIKGLPPLAQRALLGALADRGDRTAAGVAADLVDSPDPEVATEALEALGRIGTAATVPNLLAAGAQGAAGVRQAARQSLALLSGPQVDDRLLQLAQSGPVPLRTEAMLALASRGYSPAVPVLLRVAAEKEAPLQTAAFGALAALAREQDYLPAIDCVLRGATPAVTDAAERALVAIAQHLPGLAARTRPLLDQFGALHGQQRCLVIRVLGALGGPEALRAIVGSFQDGEPEVRDVAVRTVADWPEESAADDLLKLSLDADSPVHRTLALRGYLRLAIEAKSGQAARLTRAVEAARTEADKRSLLGALAESGQPAALEPASRLLSDPAVRGDAAVAVLNLASKAGAQDPVAAEAALKKVVETAGDSTLVGRAQRMLRDGWSTAETISAPYAPSVGVERQKQLAAALPPEDKLVAYLDCGILARVEGAGGLVLRQLSGKPWTFEGYAANPAAGTVTYDGRAIEFTLEGLESARAYAIGFTWWDGDGGGRSQSVRFLGVNGTEPVVALPVTRLPSGAANQPPATIQLPVPAAAVAQGRARVAFTHQSGPNAVLGELWLIETKPGSRSATQVVQTGVEVRKPKPADLTPLAPGTKILIVTGDDYPGHAWPQTAPALKAILENDPRLQVRIVEDPEALASPQLQAWDAVILHFMNWEKPGPGPAARENLRRFVAGGKGMMLTHFACGAWGTNEWPEFKLLAGRIYDPKLRGHDPYGKFRVEIADPDHPITRGLEPFETMDELYTCLTGDAPIHVVAKATSKVDQKDYPMAFVLNYGQGRVFHCVLGHNTLAYTNSPGVGDLVRRGCAWAAGLPPTR